MSVSVMRTLPTKYELPRPELQEVRITPEPETSFTFFTDKPFQGGFFADVFGVLTVNVPDDSEWFGWCSFDPYFDTLNVVACATGALENLCISDERVILNRSRAA